MENMYEKQAAAFCQSMREIAENPDTLERLKSYLSDHFPRFLRAFDTPSAAAEELDFWTR